MAKLSILAMKTGGPPETVGETDCFERNSNQAFILSFRRINTNKKGDG